jgi:methionine synthase II (cobalamin-independent)
VAEGSLPKGEKVRGDEIRTHTQELHDIYRSSSIVLVIKRQQRAGRGVFTDRGKEMCMQGFGGET